MIRHRTMLGGMMAGAAWLAPAIVMGAADAAPRRTPAARVRPAAKASPAPAPTILPSVGAVRVAEWIAAAKDSHGLPYAIVDKPAAAIFLFDAKGRQLAAEPVLIGIAPGDDATPGVGAKTLAQIGPAEKTTPAGRYLARFGLALGRERILWVDYANSVAIHPIPADAARSERRRERMLSPTPDDNRITFGCINVPRAFYTAKLSPAFRRKGGYVYVMPDTRPLEAVFPRLRVQALATPQPGGD
jgi:hypothetical protein